MSNRQNTFDQWRFLKWQVSVLLVVLLTLLPSQAQGPDTTTINDIVYRADNTPAGGTLLIFWPVFSTAAGQAVAAGTKSVTLGAGGTLSVALAPNIGATPANTFYTVVYQLNDGTVKTEFWVVPTSSPTTIAAMRTTPGSGTSATSLATQQFVNAALAGKANDAAVVHLSGSETITGTKQFSIPPSVPAPSHATDVVNKAYVDTSVTNAGSGSFVSKTGDAMTGPLLLPGDPAAPNQAADRHYVDSGLGAKADLISGLVPAAELATGTAGNAACLHGDSTWGGCGTSSNAIAIQSVPVDTTSPTDNQVITYVASLGKYTPKPGGGVSAGMQAVKYAPDFNWSQTAAADLSTPGAKTVSLSSCPAGVTGSESQYYVYIAGTGTAEAVLVTGGSCAGAGQAGTLQFTTANAHAAGYTISSASGGLQETLVAARFSPTNPAGSSQAGKVIVPPGEFKAYARISIRASNITVDFSGSIVECWMNDTCIFVGDPAASNTFSDVTLINPRGRPTIAGGQKPFIEVNAQKTRIFNVSTRAALSGGTFGSYVQVDDDEAFLLDGLSTVLGGQGTNYGVRCDATVCNPVIFAPGPFATFPAVGWLKNLNISLQCAGNGIDWQSGNTLRVSDSVIQGYAQYGVRAGTKRGGFGGFELDNVYEEVGACANPAGAIGQAGVIAQGDTLSVRGGEGPAGSAPQFANTGSTNYRYYIVARHATLGPSNLLYAGSALTNGSGNITVTTADIAGAATFDLLRVTAAASGPEQAPYATGNYAVAANVARASACANGVCTFIDTQAALHSYTVAAPAYFPLLDFWPGSVVLGTNQDSSSALAAARAWLQNPSSNIVAVQGIASPAVIAEQCDSMGAWTPLWLSCFSAMAPSAFYQQGALLMAVKPNADGGIQTNLKGRLNFPTLGSGPGHIITLSDSNFQKTIATANNRPANDINDAFVGYDQGDGNPAHVGISFGAPVSLSNYVGNVGDGSNWLERLTANLKEFKSNVQMDGTLTVVGSVTANSFVSAGTGPWNLQGNFGALTAAPAGKSMIGFGTSGKLQVSENGGAVLEVAKLDSGGNVSGNANTATQLAQTPTQCSGSFATGIQANGNANCGTASVMQLTETTPPTGIPNYGLFWFDSACHCPKVIDNNGQPVQLGLLNVFNSDAGGTNSANTLEEVNGTNPQALRVYGTWSSATNWERTGLGWDVNDGYFVVKNENSGTGQQRGLGFWLGTHIVWAMDTLATLKPFADNSYNIGSTTLRPKTIYAGTSFDLTTSGAQTFELCNDSTTGTSLNFVAKLNGANPSCAVKAAASDTFGILGIVAGGSGTTGNAVIAYKGFANCSFDGATTAGDYAQISSTNAADCHDAGAGYPSAGQVLGRVLSTNASAGTYVVLLGADPQAGSGAVASVFGRSGTITAASGDYSVGQITGAAPLASPVFSGTVDLSNGQAATEIPNASSTGTTLNALAKLSSGNLVATSTTDTGGALGIVVGGAGTTGNAKLARTGQAACIFDNATTAGDFVQISSTSAGGCHDAGSSTPSTGQVVGRVLSTNAASGTYPILITGAESGPILGSVFGRTGIVSAQAGDYSVSQITGAAPLASPTFTGTPAAPTPAASDNSTKIATTAYVQAQTCPIWFTTPNAASTVNFTTTANKAALWGAVLYCNLLTTQVTYDVTTADNTTNTYDLGIVNSSGTVVAHLGSTAGTAFAPSTGWKTVNWTATAQLPPGKYYLALTTSCTASCAVLEGGNSGAGLTFAGNISESVTTGGTLPATVTVPSDSYTASTIPTFSLH